MSTLLISTGIGFCVVFVGIAVYAIYTASKMKPLTEEPPRVDVATKEDINRLVDIAHAIQLEIASLNVNLAAKEAAEKKEVVSLATPLVPGMPEVTKYYVQDFDKIFAGVKVVEVIKSESPIDPKPKTGEPESGTALKSSTKKN